ncbi:uncharacterized protein LOC110730964 isoform X2 [Chenopodium quinoa]|uniref:uncharacterized protein LOC110730964 isoform X2 n=1 Tax=Chenopodium quinoa TaxID=63459 RepID=UPI000B77DA3E|nr:uncharacterized protein LOC110730964 isoform X2 [Chenopodium quinoa]
MPTIQYKIISYISILTTSKGLKSWDHGHWEQFSYSRGYRGDVVAVQAEKSVCNLVLLFPQASELFPIKVNSELSPLLKQLTRKIQISSFSDENLSFKACLLIPCISSGKLSVLRFEFDIFVFNFLCNFDLILFLMYYVLF